tara:strand:- start:12755 stop:13498 length:744 start_codon:yes stop_codon:yes gene_type:complete
MSDDFIKNGYHIYRDYWKNDLENNLNKLIFLARRRIFFYKIFQISGFNYLKLFFKRRILRKKTPKRFLIELLREGEFKHIKSLYNIANDPIITSKVKEYLGKSAKITGCGLWFSEPKKTKLTKSQLYHLDKPGNYIKVFISLSNINKLNGAFTFIDSKNTKKFIDKHIKNPDMDSTTIDKFNDNYVYSLINKNSEKKFTGSIGDILFCDTSNCLHQGSRVEKGYRIMLMLVYASNTMPNDKASLILR